MSRPLKIAKDDTNKVSTHIDWQAHYVEYDAKGLLLFVCCVWIIQISYSNMYLRYFKMGPLEWLWKRLTYGEGFNR